MTPRGRVSVLTTPVNAAGVPHTSDNIASGIKIDVPAIESVQLIRNVNTNGRNTYNVMNTNEVKNVENAVAVENAAIATTEAKSYRQSAVVVANVTAKIIGFDSKSWNETGDDGETIVHRKMVLKLSETLPRTLGAEDNYEVVESNLVDFSCYRLTEEIGLANPKVAIALTKFRNKTGKRSIPDYVIMTALTNAIITIAVTKVARGTKYRVQVDDTIEIKEAVNDKLLPTIVDIDFDDDAIDEFKAELADAIAEFKAEQDAAAAAAKLEAAQITATINANDKPF